MLDSSKILKTFKGTAPIFPLSEFVMFPRTAYSFNIFEPRYKQLTDHILSGDRFFCLTLIKNQKKGRDSELYKCGTLSYVIEDKKKGNGNYNIIASGLKKVSIIELESEYLYRIGQLKLINYTV